MKEQKFLELAKQYESLKDQLDKVREQLTESMTELGLNTFLQDPETKIVYQIIKPQGTFISFKEIDYIRTKKEDERAGSLSVKKANEAGFVV